MNGSEPPAADIGGGTAGGVRNRPLFAIPDSHYASPLRTSVHQGSRLDDEHRRGTIMRWLGVALLVVGSLAAIGMLGLLAQLPHAAVARDDAGVRSIVWIGGASLVVSFGCYIGGLVLLFRRQ